MEKKSKLSPGKILVLVVLILLSIIWLLPVVSTLLIAFKTPKEFLETKFYNLPQSMNFMNNLNSLFESYRLQSNFTNSLIYAIFGTIGCVILSSFAAYGLTKLQCKLSFLIFLIIYSGTVFPFQMYLVPLFEMYNAWNIYDTRLGMILLYTGICTPFATFLYRGYFLSIDNYVQEAAMIDGCGPVRMFFRIYAPQLLSPTAVVILFQATWIWNDLLFGMILSSSEAVRPIMVAITQIVGTGGGNIPLMMTGVLYTSIPTVVLFILLRKYFVQGYAMGVAK